MGFILVILLVGYGVGGFAYKTEADEVFNYDWPLDLLKGWDK